ncbi:MAG: acyl-CoA reductase [Flavobacteriales bacterium]|nr:acyl-CoA reductase [Flavobacteriales bacterium]
MPDSKINALVQLGNVMRSIGEDEAWQGFDLGITEVEFEKLKVAVNQAKIHNGWFERSEVLRAFRAWGDALNEDNLILWMKKYAPIYRDSKRIAIIMAGNIPLVGLHDLICVYLSGHIAKIKMSSDDNKLLPALLDVWRLFDDNLSEVVQIVGPKLVDFDAVIATGSNNTARHFEQYFGKYPHIIRKNRTSVAIISGQEAEEELKNLATDIFAYFGLGCRNVTKLYLPKGYDLNKIFGGLFHYQEVVYNKKYGNNYDYHKAIFMLEGFDLLENGFVLMKEDSSLTSPIGTLYYEYYDDEQKLRDDLKLHQSEIQCIVSQKDIPFGNAQVPALWDYADGVDTMEFLKNL